MIPPILAVMFHTFDGLPIVSRLHLIHDGVPLRVQAKRALAAWMESDDQIMIDHTPSGRVAVIVTYDGETSDAFAVEVPAEKRREAIYRWVREAGFDPGPWSAFTDEQAIDWLTPLD